MALYRCFLPYIWLYLLYGLTVYRSSQPAISSLHGIAQIYRLKRRMEQETIMDFLEGPSSAPLDSSCSSSHLNHPDVEPKVSAEDGGKSSRR